ncbi:MAG: LURP-one-related family protein [Clostridia bacterium]|nr:LURP-one-related family protein [Clostridia bacterium]
MTTYCIREQIFSLGDRFHIMDETGAVCFIAESELFTFGRKLHLYRAAGDDTIGEEVAFIEQEIVLFSRPRYHIMPADSAAFTVVSEFSFFSRSYSVPERGWEITGDFFDHDYTVMQDGATAAEVSKEWFTFGDCYTVRAEDDADALAVLCVALVIDCMDEQRSN